MSLMSQVYCSQNLESGYCIEFLIVPVPGLFAQQQQQQMAFAALAALLRKDMPNITENQIRDMMPLLYSANPTVSIT